MSNKTPSDNPEKTESAPKLDRRRSIYIYLLVTLILGLMIGLFLRQNRNNSQSDCTDNRLPTSTTISIDDVRLAAEVAETGAEKQQGLSGRKCLEDGTAMLFRYDRAGDYCYWMKDMKFPIDMIWLDDEKQVVTIRSNVTPETYPQSFCPERPAQYVVEVQAGLALRSGWSRGTQFNF